MNPICILAIGFVLGSLVSIVTLLALVAKYKLENVRVQSWIDMLEKRVNQIDSQRKLIVKRMADTNAEAEYLKSEVDRLRNEKLRSWDIPDKM